MAALLGAPEALLDPARRSQTSFFERMERDHPEDLRAGLRRLEAELRAGTAPRRSGEASMIGWVKGLMGPTTPAATPPSLDLGSAHDRERQRARG